MTAIPSTRSILVSWSPTRSITLDKASEMLAIEAYKEWRRGQEEHWCNGDSNTQIQSLSLLFEEDGGVGTVENVENGIALRYDIQRRSDSVNGSF